MSVQWPFEFWEQSQTFEFETRLLYGATDPLPTYGMSPGYPAIGSILIDSEGDHKQYTLYEIVPGTQREALYHNPLTLSDDLGMLVDVKIQEKKAYDNLWSSFRTVWPIEWFGLEDTPPIRDPIADYDRAMKIL